jgi:hypothetical protein
MQQPQLLAFRNCEQEKLQNVNIKLRYMQSDHRLLWREFGAARWWRWARLEGCPYLEICAGARWPFITPVMNGGPHSVASPVEQRSAANEFGLALKPLLPFVLRLNLPLGRFDICLNLRVVIGLREDAAQTQDGAF